MNDKIAILLVLYNDIEHLKSLLQSIINQQNVNISIFALDCHNKQQSLKYLQEIYPVARCYAYKGNLGYAAANNFLVKEAKKNGFYKAVICNTDIVLDKYCISNLSKALRKSYVAVGPLLYYGTPQKTKGLHSFAEEFDFKSYKVKVLNKINSDITLFSNIQEVNILTGCMFMFNIDLFIACGMINEDGFMYGEEVDLAIKFKQMDYKLLCVKDAVAWHNHKEKSSNVLYDFSFYYMKRNYLLLCRRYGNVKALRKSLLIDFLQVPKKILLAVIKGDIRGLKYYYKGIYDGLRGIKGRIDNL